MTEEIWFSPTQCAARLSHDMIGKAMRRMGWPSRTRPSIQKESYLRYVRECIGRLSGLDRLHLATRSLQSSQFLTLLLFMHILCNC